MKISNAFVLPAPWRRVAELLRDPQFNEEREKIRDAVVSANFHVLEEGEDTARYELRTTEYRRNKRGKINRSSTFEATSTLTWDGVAKTMSWRYLGQDSSVVEIGGVYRLVPLGDDSTRLVHDVTVEVHIPIIGRGLAKLIARQFEHPDPRYEALWRRYLASGLR